MSYKARLEPLVMPVLDALASVPQRERVLLEAVTSAMMYGMAYQAQRSGTVVNSDDPRNGTVDAHRDL